MIFRSTPATSHDVQGTKVDRVFQQRPQRRWRSGSSAALQLAAEFLEGTQFLLDGHAKRFGRAVAIQVANVQLAIFTKTSNLDKDNEEALRRLEESVCLRSDVC